MKDEELLLLSWAQLVAYSLAGEEGEQEEARTALEQTLADRFGITSISLISRTYDAYRVAYMKEGAPQSVTFEADEVETIL